MDFPHLERYQYKPQQIACESCGHSEWETWHKLSSAHMRGLIKLAEAVESVHRPVTRYEAGIANDGSEYGNFAAMRWWGLIESHPGDTWAVTDRGWEFLGFRRSVSKYVLTYKGEMKGLSVELIDATKAITEEVWTKPDYVGHRHQHVPKGALVV